MSSLLVLEDSRQVGVTRAGQMNFLDLAVRVLDRPRVHADVPVLVVAVGDQQRDRAAEGAAVADAGADLGRVGLDLHPAAAAVTELAPRHVAVEAVAIEQQARGHALDDRRQARAV